MSNESTASSSRKRKSDKSNASTPAKKSKVAAPSQAQPAPDSSSATPVSQPFVELPGHSARKEARKQEKRERKAREKAERKAQRKAARKAERQAAKAAKRAQDKQQDGAASGSAEPAATSTSTPAGAEETVSPFFPRPPPPPRNKNVNPFLAARQSRSAAAAPAGLDPSQFPPGFDFSALAGYVDRSGAAGTSGEDGTSRTRTRSSTQAAEQASAAALLDRVQATISAPGYVAPRASATASSSRVTLPSKSRGGASGMPRVRASGGNATTGLTDREATIDDARGLTHLEMLATKLYQPHQLQWLKEKYGLEWRQGRLSKTEEEAIDNAIAALGRANGMTVDQVKGMVVAREADQAQLYADLFVDIATAVGTRPNRSLRKVVRERCQKEELASGPWTTEEEDALERAVALHGNHWMKIAPIVGRSVSSCRSHIEKLRAAKAKGGVKSGEWSDADVKRLKDAVAHFMRNWNPEAEGRTYASRDVPWQAVAKRMGDRLPLSCSQKWRDLTATETRAANAGPESSQMWVNGRDNYTLYHRIKGDEYAMSIDDETAIDWSKIPSDDFCWPPSQLRENWSILKKRLLPSTLDYSSKRLKATLKALKHSVQKESRTWLETGHQHYEFKAHRLQGGNATGANDTSAGASVGPLQYRRQQRKQARDDVAIDLIDTDEEEEADAAPEDQRNSPGPSASAQARTSTNSNSTMTNSNSNGNASDSDDELPDVSQAMSASAAAAQKKQAKAAAAAQRKAKSDAAAAKKAKADKKAAKAKAASTSDKGKGKAKAVTPPSSDDDSDEMWD